MRGVCVWGQRGKMEDALRGPRTDGRQCVSGATGEAVEKSREAEEETRGVGEAGASQRTKADRRRLAAQWCRDSLSKRGNKGGVNLP